jgi:hypothetical protein
MSVLHRRGRCGPNLLDRLSLNPQNCGSAQEESRRIDGQHLIVIAKYAWRDFKTIYEAGLMLLPLLSRLLWTYRSLFALKTYVTPSNSFLKYLQARSQYADCLPTLPWMAEA